MRNKWKIAMNQVEIKEKNSPGNKNRVGGVSMVFEWRIFKALDKRLYINPLDKFILDLSNCMKIFTKSILCFRKAAVLLQKLCCILGSSQKRLNGALAEIEAIVFWETWIGTSVTFYLCVWRAPDCILRSTVKSSVWLCLKQIVFVSVCNSLTVSFPVLYFKKAFKIKPASRRQNTSNAGE